MKACFHFNRANQFEASLIIGSEEEVKIYFYISTDRARHRLWLSQRQAGRTNLKLCLFFGKLRSESRSTCLATI